MWQALKTKDQFSHVGFLFLSAKPIDSSHTKVTCVLPLSCGPFRTPDPLHVMPRSGLLKQLYRAPGTDCVRKPSYIRVSNNRLSCNRFCRCESRYIQIERLHTRKGLIMTRWQLWLHSEAGKHQLSYKMVSARFLAFLAAHILWLHYSRGIVSGGVTTSPLTTSVTSCMIMPVCACVWMICSVYHFPPRVAFQRDIPSCWRECWFANRDKINACHSPPHGIPSSHRRGQEVRNRVMTTNCAIQVKWQRGLWKPLKALAL